MNIPTLAQFNAWSDFFLVETDPSKRADLARRILVSIDLPVAPDIDVYPAPSDVDRALVLIEWMRLHPQAHAHEVGRRAFLRELDVTRRHAWSLSSPIAATVSWQHLARVVHTVRPQLATSLGRLPNTTELYAAVRATTLEWGRSRLSATEHDLPEERQQELVLGRLRKQGLTGALEQLGKIAGLEIVVRPMGGDAAEVFLAAMREPLAGPVVTDPQEMVAHHSGTLNPRGAHSQMFFGPIVDDTCACGNLGAVAEPTLCERCGVTTGPASGRATAIAHIGLLKPVQNPLTAVRQAGVPVIGPALRPIRVTGTHFEIDELDESYRRFVMIGLLEERATLRRYATTELESLAQGEINRLVARAQLRSSD